jgi:SAM-dependent methyltransferase
MPAVSSVANVRDRTLRRLVPSVPLLTRRRWLMAAFDGLDRVTSFPFPELRELPPNRMRLRVGVGNRILFNQVRFFDQGAATVVSGLHNGTLRLDSRIVDIGCGCGRFPLALRRYGFHGRYDGIDVDREMIDWCRNAFPGDIYRFHLADVYSEVYNPGGKRGPYELPVADQSADVVIGHSIFTHLLEDDLRNYVREAVRVLVPGGQMDMGVFCLEDMEELGLLGGRWEFPYRVGRAHVQVREYPEAAVAYERAFLVDVCREAGFTDVDVRARRPHGWLLCRK